MNLEGCIAFTAKKGSFVSKAIRWFTKSEWSHTFFIWRKIGDTYLCIEANDFEVAISPLDKFLKDPSYRVQIFNPIKIPVEDRIKVGDEIVQGKKKEFKIGDVYGYLQLIGFAIVILLKRFFGIERRSNIFTKGPICSEIVAWYLIYIKALSPGDFLFEKRDINLISPDDLYRHMYVIHPDKFELVFEKEYGEIVEKT